MPPVHECACNAAEHLLFLKSPWNSNSCGCLEIPLGKQPHLSPRLNCMGSSGSKETVESTRRIRRRWRTSETTTMGKHKAKDENCLPAGTVVDELEEDGMTIGNEEEEILMGTAARPPSIARLLRLNTCALEFQLCIARLNVGGVANTRRRFSMDWMRTRRVP